MSQQNPNLPDEDDFIQQMLAMLGGRKPQPAKEKT